MDGWGNLVTKNEEKSQVPQKVMELTILVPSCGTCRTTRDQVQPTGFVKGKSSLTSLASVTRWPPQWVSKRLWIVYSGFSKVFDTISHSFLEKLAWTGALFAREKKWLDIQALNGILTPPDFGQMFLLW